MFIAPKLRFTVSSLSDSRKKFFTLTILLLFTILPVYALNLPHNIFKWEEIPVEYGEHTPAYIANTSYTEEDLGREIELKYTYDMKTFLENLDRGPVKVYYYLRNNFDYQPYYGSLKGAEGAFLERSGNDLDLANLLVELYRELGIPSRYVHGNILLSEEDLSKMFGVDADNIEKVLSSGMIPYSKNEDNYIVDHFWVEAYINGKWIALDPSFKYYEYVEPVLDLDELGLNTENISERLTNLIKVDNNTINTSPITYDKFPELSFDFLFEFGDNLTDVAEEQIGDLSEQSIYSIIKRYDEFRDNFMGNWRIVPEERSIFPEELPYKVHSVIEEFSSIPDKYRHKIKITVDVGGIDAILNTSQIAGKRVILTYIPYNKSDADVINSYENIEEIPIDEVNISPVLMVDGYPKAFGTKSGFGEKANLTVSFFVGERFLGSDTTRITLGGDYAIGMDMQKVSEQLLSYRINRLKITNFMFENGFTNVTREEIVGEILNIVSLTYWYELDSYAEKIAGHSKIRFFRVPSLLVVGGAYNVSENMKLIGMFMDIHRDYYIPIADEQLEKRFMVLTGLKGAELEAKIIEELTGAPAISTGKIFSIARDSGIPIYIVNSTNVNSTLSLLNISLDDKNAIENAVSKGLTVIVPAENVVINRWEGTGFYMINESSGAMAYMISGGIRGGFSLSEFLQERFESLYENLAKTEAGKKFLKKLPGVGLLVSQAENIITGVIELYYAEPCERAMILAQKLVDCLVDLLGDALSDATGLDISITLVEIPVKGTVVNDFTIDFMDSIKDTIKEYAKRKLGIDNLLADCPQPSIFIRERKEPVVVPFGKKVTFTPFLICNYWAMSGKKAYSPLIWVIPKKANRAYDLITRIEPRSGSTTSGCDRVRVTIDTSFVKRWAEIGYRQGEAAMDILLTELGWTNRGLYFIPIVSNDPDNPVIYAPVRFIVTNETIVKVEESAYLSYKKGGSDKSYVSVLNLGLIPINLSVKPEKISKLGIEIEYPKVIKPGEWKFVKITSKGAPLGDWRTKITLNITAGNKTIVKKVTIRVHVSEKGKDKNDQPLPEPGNDHPDDNSDVPRTILSKENNIYAILREGIKNNLSEAYDIYWLIDYFNNISAVYTEKDSLNLMENVSRIYNTISTKFNVKEFEENAASVAVLERGFYVGASNILSAAGIPHTIVKDFDPVELAKTKKVLIIPSGGLFGAKTEIFKEKIEKYLEEGGNIIVFSQQFGRDYEILPLSPGGVGWAEDQMCFRDSLYVTQDNPVFSSVTGNVVSEEVDGYFDKYPATSITLLSRTKNNFPAMLMYPYGNGYVIATTLYSDWKSEQSKPSYFITSVIRDLITYITLNQDVYEIGLKKSWGLYFPESSYIVPVKIDNLAQEDADKIKFVLISPSGKISKIFEVNETIEKGTSKIVNVTILKDYFPSDYLHPLELGIWTLDYILMKGEDILYTKYNAKGISLNLYKDNDYLFNYVGKEKYLVWATSSIENAKLGDTVKITFHIINKANEWLNGSVGIGDHVVRYGWTVHEARNISVPPNSYMKEVFELRIPPLTSGGTLSRIGRSEGITFYLGFYKDKSAYQGSGNFYDAFLRAEKGIYIRLPKNIHAEVELDKREYKPGETLKLNVTLKNYDTVDWEFEVKATAYKGRTSIATESTVVDLSAGEEKSINLDVKLPTTLKPGWYRIWVDVLERNSKAGITGTGTSFSRVEPKVVVKPSISFNPPSFNLDVNIENEMTLSNPVLYLTHTISEYGGNSVTKTYRYNLTFENYRNTTKLPIKEFNNFAKHVFRYRIIEDSATNKLLSAGSLTFDRKLGIYPEVSFSGIGGDILNLTINLENPNDIAEDFDINVTIPALSYSGTSSLSIEQKAKLTLNYTFDIPKLSNGSYPIIIRVQKNNTYIEKRTEFYIRDSDLSASIPFLSYSAGDNASAYVINRGGVDTTANVTLCIYKNDVVLARKNYILTIPANETVAVNITIPQNITPNCFISLNATDLRNLKSVERKSELYLKGMRLEASLVEPIYAGEEAFVSIENVGGMSERANITMELRKTLFIPETIVEKEYTDVLLDLGKPVNLSLPVPEDANGVYELVIRAKGEYSSDWLKLWINVMGFNLSAEVERDSYNAGDAIDVLLRNNGGGHKNITVSAYLKNSITIFLGSKSVDVGKLEEKKVSFEIPNSVPNGTYVLFLNYGGKTYSKVINVKSLELAIDLQKESFDIDEGINLVISNLGALNAQLRINYTLSYYKGNTTLDLKAGESKAVTLYTPRDISSGYYTLNIEAKDLNIGRTFYETLMVKIRGFELDIKINRTNLVTGDNLILILENTGGLDQNLTLTLKVDGNELEKNVEIAKGERKDVVFQLPALAKGEYNVELIAHDDNSNRVLNRIFKITVSGFRIDAELNKESFTLSEKIGITFINENPNLDADCGYTIFLIDSMGNTFYLGSGNITIPKSGSNYTEIDLEEGLTSGEYNLMIDLLERNTGDSFSITKDVHIDGIESRIEVDMPEEAFYDDYIKAEVNVDQKGILKVQAGEGIAYYPYGIANIEEDDGLWIFFREMLGFYKNGKLTTYYYPTPYGVGWFESYYVPALVTEENVFLADFHGNLLVFDKTSKSWSIYNSSNIAGYPETEWEACITSFAYYNGSIWLGFYGNGLVKLNFDELTAEVYNTSNSPLPSDWVFDIESNGTSLWVATDLGVVKISSTWEVWDSSQLNVLGIRDIEIVDGDIWIAGDKVCQLSGECYSSELLSTNIDRIFSDSKSLWVTYTFWSGADGVSRFYFENKTWVHVYESDSILGDLIDFEDGIYATKKYGIIENGVNRIFGPLNSVGDIFYGDRIYASSGDGVSIYDPESDSWAFLTSDIFKFAGNLFYNGKLIFSNSNKLVIYDFQNISVYDSSNSPFTSSTYIRGITGNESVIYVGTSEGLIAYDMNNDVFAVYDTSNSNLTTNDIRSVYLYENELWIADSSGVGVLNIESGEFNRCLTGIGTKVLADEDKVYAIVDYPNNLLIYDKETKRKEVFNSTNGLLSDCVSDMDVLGGKIFVTYCSGEKVSVFDGKSWKHLNIKALSVSAGRGVAFGDGGLVIYESRTAEYNVTPGMNKITIEPLHKEGKRVFKFYLISEKGQLLNETAKDIQLYGRDIEAEIISDKDIYKKGEEVSLKVSIKNHAPITDRVGFNLSIDGNNYTEEAIIPPAFEYVYEVKFEAEKSITTKLSLLGREISKEIRVVEPKAAVEVEVPEVVSLDPFNVSVWITNTGEIEINVSVEIGGEKFNETIAVNETAYIYKTMKITQDRNVTIRLSGDVEKVLTKHIILGEKVDVRFNPEYIISPGENAIPVEITNTGILDSDFNITIYGDYTYNLSVFVPAMENTTVYLPINLPEGLHTLFYESKFGNGSFTVEVVREKVDVNAEVVSLGYGRIGAYINVENLAPIEFSGVLEITSPFTYNRTHITLESLANSTFYYEFEGTFEEGYQNLIVRILKNGELLIEKEFGFITNPDYVVTIENVGDTYRIGELMNFTVGISNVGSAIGKDALFVEIPGIYRNYTEVTINPREKLSFNFSVELPKDMPTRDMEVLANIGNTSAEEKFKLIGINLTVRPYLDKKVYSTSDNLTLYLDVSNNEGVSVEGNITVSCGDIEKIGRFSLTGYQSKTYNFNLPVCDRVFYSLMLDTGRLVDISSIPVHIQDNQSVFVYTDKSKYRIGETMTVFVEVASPAILTLFIFGNSTVLNVTDNTSIQVVIPDVPSGTYEIIYGILGGVTFTYSFDVFSPSAKVLSFIPSKDVFSPKEKISFSAKIYSDEDVEGKIRLWLYDSLDSLVGYDEKLLNLKKGENIVNITTELSPPCSGEYYILYGIYRGLNSTLIASGIQDIQTSGPSIVSITTDSLEYYEDEEVILNLTVSGKGEANITIYGKGKILEETVFLSGTESLNYTLSASKFARSLEVVLTQDNNTLSRTLSLNIRNLPPVVDFEFENGYVNEDIVFDASKTYDPGEDNLTFIWDFGDGNTTTNVRATHRFSKPGEYAVTLKVIDEDGDWSVLTKKVIVSSRSISTKIPPSGGGGGRGGELPSPLTAPSEYSESFTKYFRANEKVSIAMPSKVLENTGITEIEALFDRAMTARITVSKVSSLPSDVPAPAGSTYVYFEIVFTEFGTSNKVEPSGYINFRMPKDWLNSIGAEASDVQFLKYTGGKWIELSSEIVDEDDSYYYFRVSLESFSLFAVVAKPKVKVSPITPLTTPKPTPAAEETPAEIPTPAETLTPKPWWQHPTETIIVAAAVFAATLVLLYVARRK